MSFLCKLLIWSFLCCLLATRVQAQATARRGGKGAGQSSQDHHLPLHACSS